MISQLGSGVNWEGKVLIYPDKSFSTYKGKVLLRTKGDKAC